MGSISERRLRGPNEVGGIVKNVEDISRVLYVWVLASHNYCAAKTDVWRLTTTMCNWTESRRRRPEVGQIPGWTWFILVKDDDGHSYVIPETYREQWNKWVESTSDRLPSYASWVDGIRFKQWEEV